MINLTQSVKESVALPVWFKNNALVIALQREELAKVHKQRAAAKKEIDSLQREGAVVIPCMEKELETAKQEYEAARRHAQEVLDKCLDISGKLNSTKRYIERQINTQEDFLRKSYDAEIDEAVMFFRNELTRLRLPGTLSIQVFKKSQQNALNFKQELALSSNSEAVEAALTYCRAALDELEVMKLSLEADINRIKELLENVPRSDVFIYLDTYGHAI
jgi:hypothetical protein